MHLHVLVQLCTLCRLSWTSLTWSDSARIESACIRITLSYACNKSIVISKVICSSWILRCVRTINAIVYNSVGTWNTTVDRSTWSQLLPGPWRTVWRRDTASCTHPIQQTILASSSPSHTFTAAAAQAVIKQRHSVACRLRRCRLFICWSLFFYSWRRLLHFCANELHPTGLFFYIL